MGEKFDVAAFYSPQARKIKKQFVTGLFSELDKSGQHIVFHGPVHDNTVASPLEQLTKQDNPLALVVSGDSTLAYILTVARQIDENSLNRIRFLYIPVGKHSRSGRAYGIEADPHKILQTIERGSDVSIKRMDVVYTYRDGDHASAVSLVSSGFVTLAGKYAQQLLHPETHRHRYKLPPNIETYTITSSGKTIYDNEAILFECIAGNNSPNIYAGGSLINNNITLATVSRNVQLPKEIVILTNQVTEGTVCIRPFSTAHYDGQKTIFDWSTHQPHELIGVSQADFRGVYPGARFLVPPNRTQPV